MVLLVLLLGLPPMWALVPCVMFSVGTQGLVGANTQACFMTYFKQESGSANAVLGRVPIHHRRKRGAVGDSAAQWFRVGDGGHDAGFNSVRDCVALALLSSGLERKR